MSAAPVLVTGASGFLGWHLARTLRDAGHAVIGTSRDGSGLPEGVEGRALALDDGGGAGAALVTEARPSAVFHLAALARPDVCAREPRRAQRVNADATGALARAAAGAGAAFLYTSSDLVFDGTQAPYGEDAPTSPLGPYMQTKAAGEEASRAAHAGALVVRVALIHGVAGGRGGGFTRVMIDKLRAGEELKLFSDQFRTPVEVRDAAELLVALHNAGARGVVHLGGPQRVSRHEHGVILADALGADPALCRAIRMTDLEGLAPRPADVSLVSERLVGLVGRSAIDVAAGCERIAEAIAGRD